MFSPASRNSTISVLRLSAPILVSPATYWLSHFTLNRKVRNGSNRFVLALIRAIVYASSWRCGMTRLCHLLIDLLLESKHDEFRRLQRRETDEDIDHAVIDVRLIRRIAIHLHEERIVRLAPLERAGAELRQHEGADIEPETRPE